MTQTEDKIDRRFDYLRYINTILIAFILAFSVMCWNGIRSVKSVQEENGKMMVLIQERQSINIQNIASVSLRVTAMETLQSENIKAWVELNFIRKPQK